MMKNFLMVALGGALGSGLRYLIQEGLHKQIQGFAPYGTFVVNILGCFLIGLLLGWFEQGKLIQQQWNLLLITGFCGGFTTFATFAMQGNELFLAQKPMAALMYLGLSVVIGLALAYLGYRLVQHG